MKKPCSFNEWHFQRALGCICTVFRSRDCSVSRSHLHPARPGKKSHKSLRVSSRCHVWWKGWTNLFQDFYQMYPVRLDICVLPLPESVLNSHNLQRCLGPRFQKLSGSMSFLVVEWTLTQIIFFLSPKHVASYTKNGCGDRRSVLHNTEKISLLWMSSTKRDRQEKPLENWHWAQCLFPGICEESHLKEVDRPSFAFLKLSFKKLSVMKYRDQMHYRNQLDKNPDGFGIFTIDNWLCSDLTAAFPQGWAEPTPISSDSWIQPHVHTLPVEFIPVCTRLTAQSNQVSDISGFLKRPSNLTYVF